MKIIEKANWPRREIFDFFSALSQPFYSVTFRVDVTALYDYVKARGISFYYSLIWLCTHAANRVEAFHYGLENGRLVRWDSRSPSFTDLKKGSELFHIVTMPCEGTMAEFCAAAAERSLGQDCFIRPAAETQDLLYFSCLPWLDLTALTNERDMDVDDAIPRLAWGGYTEENGRKSLGMSVEVNHRFLDGVHIGHFAAELAALIAALEL